MTRTYTKMMAFIISIILILGMQTCLAFNPLLQGLFRVKQWGNSIGFHPMENPLKPLVVTVPWFPMSKQDLDVIRRKTLEAGSDLDANHPGFKVRTQNTPNSQTEKIGQVGQRS